MNEMAFVKRREADWARLSLLCDKASVSPTQLNDEELLELIRLHRAVSRDLSLARTKSGNQDLVRHLNDLVSRSYSELYRPAPKPLSRAVPDALAGIAQAGRNLRWFTLASLMIFLLGAAFGVAILRLRPDMRDLIIPPTEQQNFDAWTKSDFEDRTLDESLVMTGFYSANNPRVAIITVAVGAASFGIYSAALLFQNGQIIGALGNELFQVGKLDKLATVLPHGVTEISGMILAGSAGLRLGWALFAPGRRRRGESLRHAGPDVMFAAVGAVVCMFLAAPIEGFVSFNPTIPMGVKLTLAVATALAWAIFWTGYHPSSTRVDSKEKHDHDQGREVVHGM